MQLESNFSCVLNNSTFVDFTGMSPSLHSTKLYHLHSLPPFRSRGTTGLGFQKSLQRLHFLGQSCLHTWENGCLPEAQAVIRMIQRYHGPRQSCSHTGEERKGHICPSSWQFKAVSLLIDGLSFCTSSATRPRRKAFGECSRTVLLETISLY